MITAAIWLAAVAFDAVIWWLADVSERSNITVTPGIAACTIASLSCSTAALVLATIAVNR